MIRLPKKYEVDEFAQILESENVENAREEIGYAHQTSWLFCNNDEDFKNWSYGMKDGVEKAINFFSHP